MLNLDQHILSIALAINLKRVILILISPFQTAHVNGRFIVESGYLLSNVIEVCDIEKLIGYIMTIGFDKAFDSTNHAFHISNLKKIGFGKYFIGWIQLLLKNKEPCVINASYLLSHNEYLIELLVQNKPLTS